uniref:Uncharacterized protein n=1 Tax=Panagrolaimus sp. ES5 TaxID=591445 RepID=A0AC34G7R2_9BILA
MENAAKQKTQIAEIEKTNKSSNKKKPEKEGRKRDPGFAWILDFNNDGIVSIEENDMADQVFQG